VHWLDVLLVSVVGEHTSWLNCAGAITVSVKLCELLPTVAVISADVLEFTVPTVAVKEAEL